MTFDSVRLKAKPRLGPYCKACPTCNGQACKGVIPGPGGKGTGLGFVRNYEDLRQYALCMNTLYDATKVDTRIDLWGKTYSMPIFAGPVGAVQMHYSDLYDDLSYSQVVVEGSSAMGTLAFTGDGVDDGVFHGTIKAISDQAGRGVPTIKPWTHDEVIKKIRLAETAQVPFVAMDLDAAGLAFLAKLGKPVAPKGVHALREIIKATDLPFVVKGVMTTKMALDALEAGAHGIVVSNHGGRVLDETPSTISQLEAIADLVKDKMMIWVDGGFRSGLDVFKALALGAHGVLVARPFVTAVYGGGVEGVKTLYDQLHAELVDAMVMTGCATLKDITREKIIYLK